MTARSFPPDGWLYPRSCWGPNSPLLWASPNRYGARQARLRNRGAHLEHGRTQRRRTQRTLDKIVAKIQSGEVPRR